MFNNQNRMHAENAARIKWIFPWKWFAANMRWLPSLLIVQILVLVIEMPIVARRLLGKIDLVIRMGLVVVDIMAPNEQNTNSRIES